MCASGRRDPAKDSLPCIYRVVGRSIEAPGAWLGSLMLVLGLLTLLQAPARAALQRARADSMVLIAGVLQEVRLTFFRALAAEQGMRLVEAQQQLADSVARLARRRFEAGDISLLELEQVSQDARRQQLALSSARETHRVAIAALTQAVAWTEGAPPSPSGTLDLELDAVTEPVPASLPLIEAAVADSIA